jgi:DNA replication licensing factor MCM5
MEQQTISVAKAGITTILNSRCAVLAAANPVFGRYDDTRSAADNIDLLPTILSRFDLIFIVRDVHDMKRDAEIARHVLRVHVNAGDERGSGGAGGSGPTAQEQAGDIDIVTMKKFITYARSRVAPRLTDEAAATLNRRYVEIRAESRANESSARDAHLASTEEHGVIPITVRQLEALVRITEAVAKSALRVEANSSDVQEAMRLFQVSTLTAAKSGIAGVLESNMDADTRARVKRAEAKIAAKVPVGSSVATSRIKDLLGREGVEDHIVNLALKTMERRDEITLVHERKTIRRNK